MKSLRGKLLIASPRIVDPNFHRTVILLTEHADGGAMGLVINRAAPATVAEAVPELDWLVDPEGCVYVGGPVSVSSIIILAEFDDPTLAAVLVDGDLGFVPAELRDRDALVAATRRTRVFAGHAGWGPGQLDVEMEGDSWIVEAARREDVFTDEPDDLWATVLRRKGRDYALLATMPADPSLN